MEKLKYVFGLIILVALIFLNLNINGSVSQALAQVGPGYEFKCSQLPEAGNCNSTQASCMGGVPDPLASCMIDCEPYLYAPWVYCNGNTDPGEG